MYTSRCVGRILQKYSCQMRRNFSLSPRRLLPSSKINDVLPFETIPGPRPLPVIGNIWRYVPVIGDYNIDDLFGNAKINRTRYGPLVREQITRQHVVLHLFDPKDVEAFFRQDTNEPHRRSHRALLKLRHENPDRYNDGGIFPENGSNWLRLRKIFNQSLMKSDEILRRAPILDEVTKQAIGSFESKPATIGGIQVNDFERFLYRWSVKCALAVFLDFSSSELPDESLLDRIVKCADDQLEALAGTEIKTERWLKRPEKCPFYRKLAREEDFMYNFISKRIDHLKGVNSADKVSFINEWLEDERLDRRDITTFLIDSILANLNTTVYTCTYLLQDISTRLETVQRDLLLAEICKFPSDLQIDELVSSNLISEIPLLKDCLKETMRLHPVSIGTGRVTQQEMVLSNYKIPANVMVIAHNQAISCDPLIYERPDEFLPDRWALYRKRQRSDRPSRFAWLPFGFGQRSCIGQRLVSLQMYLLTIRLLQRFRVEFTGEIKTRTSLVHQIDGSVSVCLHHNCARQA